MHQYLIFYRAEGTDIQVLRVLDGRRRIARRMFE